MPLSQLLYAPVIKTTRRRRLVRVRHRMVFGTLAAVQQVLASLGWQINTARGERVNLSLRQQVAAIGRRTRTRCKGTVFALIACEEASLVGGDSCSCIPASPFDNLLEIARFVLTLTGR